MQTILLTFDVEDWFQVENFKAYIPLSSWSLRELRVERNVEILLQILADSPVQVNATFFVLGWIAKRCPSLVRKIHQQGHEVASHGFGHQLCYEQETAELLQDLVQSKELLENVIGAPVYGYRAPSFSISDETIQMVKKAKYLYDSSFNSYEGHGRYGSLTLPDKSQPDTPVYTLEDSFYEIPVSNLRLGQKIIPWAGGGYFRLLPSFLHQIGVRRILQKTKCYTFYMHPWEIDPNQPRMREVQPFFRFRHYVNLQKTECKLRKLIVTNKQSTFQTCHDFVSVFKEDS